MSRGLEQLQVALDANALPEDWPSDVCRNAQIEGWDYRTKQKAMRPSYEKQDCREKVEKEGIGVCAVGAYLLRKRVLELGETPEQAMRALPSASDAEGMYLDATADLGTAAGLSFPVAYLLADRNDETYHSCTPEERYEKFLAWLDKELGLVPTGGGSGDGGEHGGH